MEVIAPEILAKAWECGGSVSDKVAQRSNEEAFGKKVKPAHPGQGSHSGRLTVWVRRFDTHREHLEAHRFHRKR